jgi:hypothetical protein
MPSQPSREAGDIILGWLTRIVIGITIAGVVAFDGVSIGVAHISTIDDANSAAQAASRSWYQEHDIAKALQAAQDVAAEHEETVITKSLRVDPDGTAHLELVHDAATLVVRHVSALRSWATVKADGSGRYVGT